MKAGLNFQEFLRSRYCCGEVRYVAGIHKGIQSKSIHQSPFTSQHHDGPVLAFSEHKGEHLIETRTSVPISRHAPNSDLKHSAVDSMINFPSRMSVQPSKCG